MIRLDDAMRACAREILTTLRKQPRLRTLFGDLLAGIDFDDETSVEVNIVEMDDGRQYLELKKFSVGENTYLFFVNSTNPKDAFFRKLVVKDGKEYLFGIQDDDEYDRMYLHFQKLMLTDLDALHAKHHPEESAPGTR